MPQLELSGAICDKPACHICGTRRQRNLIISYCLKKGYADIQNVANLFLMSDEEKEKEVREGRLEKHVICQRCDSLNLSVDDLRYLKDRYFPAGDMRRYKDLQQKVLANAHKRNKGGD